MKLETAESIGFDQVSEQQLLDAFADDNGRGEFVNLSEKPEVYIQASGEDDGPYALEFRDGDADHHFSAGDTFRKADVLRAFLWYLTGDTRWRSEYSWQKLEPQAYRADMAARTCRNKIFGEGFDGPTESGCPSSSDVLVFKYSATEWLIIYGFFGLLVYLVGYPRDLGAFCVDIISVVIIIGSLNSGKELSIDFAKHRYQLRTGLFGASAQGSLNEVSHLRLVDFYYQGRYIDYHRVQVRMVWKNDQADDFGLKSVETGRDKESQTKTKNELVRYATALAARLLVPVIDDTNCAT